MNNSTAENKIEIENIITDAPDNIFKIPQQEINIVLKEKPTETIDPADATGRDKTIDELISELPGNFPDANSILKSDIFPLIIEMDVGLQEYYSEQLRKQLSVSNQTIKKALKAVKENTQSMETQDLEDVIDEDETDPDVLNMAHVIAHDPLSYKKRIEIVHRLGVIGERIPISLCLNVMDSRLLPMGIAGSDAMGMKNSGWFGSGKSFPLFIALKLFPKSAYHLIQSGSDKSLYHIQNGLKHKTLILAEALNLQSDRRDSELAYSIRSLLSEGSVKYQYTGWIDKEKVTIVKKLDGPTALVTTTTIGKLEDQLEDRLVTVHPDTSTDQSRRIVERTSEIASGSYIDCDQREIRAWVQFHRSLDNVEVIIPFATKISKHLNENTFLPLSVRRGIKKVFSAIKSVALFHQHQRNRDSMERVIADVVDYAIARQIIDVPFCESLGDSRFTDNRIQFIGDHGPITPRDLAKSLGITGAAITNWSKRWLEKGVLIWVDDQGDVISNKDDLKKMKHSGKVYLNVVGVNRLPTPYELTGDPKWNVGGELYQLHDLELDTGDDILSDDSGNLNTLDDSEGVENTQKKDNSEGCVKVLRTKSNQELKEMIRESTKKHSMGNFAPDDPETMKLYEEIDVVLKPYIPRDSLLPN